MRMNADWKGGASDVNRSNTMPKASEVYLESGEVNPISQRQLLLAADTVAPFAASIEFLYRMRITMGDDVRSPAMIQLAVTEAESRGFLAGIETALGVQGLPEKIDLEAYIATIEALDRVDEKGSNAQVADKIREATSDMAKPIANDLEDFGFEIPEEKCKGCEHFDECWPNNSLPIM
jgi:hypothetical protein